MPSYIIPQWSAPETIKALQTTRQGGYSHAPFNGFNLAQHVHDDPQQVQCNRQYLSKQLPAEPLWLNQVHSHHIVAFDDVCSGVDADGSYTQTIGHVCLVMTADCLPVLLCNKQGTVVAAVHAGWRGLAHGIIEQAVNKVMRVGQCRSSDLLIWLGPAIGANKFIVGEDVRQAFLATSWDRAHIHACFTQTARKDKYRADIYQLAKAQLWHLGIENISGGNYCTYTDEELFYSYRREAITGRMATMIWLVDKPT